MSEETKYTLTPEVLLAMANLPWPRTKTGDWLVDTAKSVELANGIEELVVKYFNADPDCFFIATALFLEENNYLPDIEKPPDPDVLDSLDELDERNW